MTNRPRDFSELPAKLQGGVSKSCRCATQHMARGVCGNCYSYYFRRTEKGVRHTREQNQRGYYNNREARLRYRANYLVKHKDRAYFTNIKSRFGFTANQYRELYESQAGRCAICRIEESKFGERLCLDHSHRSGKVRGLLCRQCNTSLGVAERRQTGAYQYYLDFPPMARLEKLKTLSDEERALWNW